MAHYYERFRDNTPARKRSDEVELTTRWTSVDSSNDPTDNNWHMLKADSSRTSHAHPHRNRAAFVAVAAALALMVILIVTMHSGDSSPSTQATFEPSQSDTQALIDPDDSSDFVAHETPPAEAWQTADSSNEAQSTPDSAPVPAPADTGAEQGMPQAPTPSHEVVIAPALALGPAPEPKVGPAMGPSTARGDSSHADQEDEAQGEGENQDGDVNTHHTAHDACDATDTSSAHLDTRVIPSAYNITILLEPEHFTANQSSAPDTFDAATAITLHPQHTVYCLPLHSKGLQYNEVLMRREGDDHTQCMCGPRDACLHQSCDKVVDAIRGAEEMVLFQFGDNALPANESVELTLKYTAQLGHDGMGLYRSSTFSYLDQQGDTKEEVLVATQFEATGARSVFPCYDEPQYKAKFSVNLQVPEGKTVLSNMPLQQPQFSVREEQQGDQQLMYSFKPTPVMSTYLLAVAVGQLSSMSGGTVEGHQVTLYAVTGKEHQLEEAMKVAVGALSFYTNFTGVQQPLTKFDLVAVPGKGGAMENWGLLLFDEDRMLWNNETEGEWQRWRVSDVICHEMAHQWFGNYVTCADWDNLAFNEGLASFMEYKCIEACHKQMPEKVLRHLATSPLGETLGVHEGVHEHALAYAADPLTSPVMPVSTGMTMTYSAAASLFIMFEEFAHYHTPGAMQEALQVVLSQNAYGSATVKDVLTAMGDAIGGGEGDVFASNALSWFYNASYPLLQVDDGELSDQLFVSQHTYHSWNVSGVCANNQLHLHTAQENSTTNKLCSTKSADLWVPMGIGGLHQGEGVGDVQWAELEGQSEALPAAVNQLPSAFVVNKVASGFFRVQYGPQHLEELIETMNDLTIDTTSAEDNVKLPAGALDVLLDASALLSDVFALALSGQVSPLDALKAASAVASSQAAKTGAGSYLLLLPIIDGLTSLQPIVSRIPHCAKALTNFTRELVQPAALELLKTANKSADTQDTFLGALAMSRVLTAAAVPGGQMSDTLCGMYTPFCPACGHARDAAYVAYVAHASGCSEARGQGHIGKQRVNTQAYAAWQEMLHCYTHEEDIAEKHRCLYALPAAQQGGLIKTTMEMVLGVKDAGEKLSLSDASAFVRLVSYNTFSKDAAWDVLQYNWDAVVKNFGDSGACSLLESLQVSASNNRLDDVTSFLTTGDAKDCPITVKQRVIGRLQQAVELSHKFAKDICEHVHTP